MTSFGLTRASFEEKFNITWRTKLKIIFKVVKAICRVHEEEKLIGVSIILNFVTQCINLYTVYTENYHT